MQGAAAPCTRLGECPTKNNNAPFGVEPLGALRMTKDELTRCAILPALLTP